VNDNGSAGRAANLRISGVGESGILLGFHVALFFVAIAPILSVEIPPLADLPNHLARLHILANLENEPALQANYEIVPRLSPYLLVDWMLTPLVRVWSVYDVGRIFVVTTMAITYGGVLLLSFLFFSRLTVWPALALPVLYNHAFAWGFLNFNFAIGLTLVAFALWVRLRQWNAIGRFAALLCLSALLYLTHMLAFGVFAVVLSAHSLSVAYAKNGPNAAAISREMISVVAPIVLVFLVYFFWLSESRSVGERLTSYGDIDAKLVVVLSPTFFSDSIADVALLAAYVGAGLFLALCGRLQLAANMAFPLVCLAIICVLMPNTLFGVWAVDFRLPPVLLMLLIASTRPKFLIGRPARPVVAGVVAAMVMLRVISLWPQFQLADRQFTEFKDAIRGMGMTEGARVLVSLDDAPGKLALPQRAFWHLAQIAVIERQAFVPFLFTGVTQVRPTARNRDLDTPVGHPLESVELTSGLDSEFIAQYRNRILDAYRRVYWADWPKHFDYLIRINPAALDNRIAAKLDPAAHYSYFDIAKIRK
jgi:hypothetical protein